MFAVLLNNNFFSYHFQALEIDSDEKSLPHLIYTHRLLPGVIKLDYYGLKLAKNTAIPDSVLKLSENIAKTLNSEWKVKHTKITLQC